MRSWTIKYHNGKPPSVNSSSRVLGPKTWCSTQSPNKNLSELKGPTPSFARIPEMLWFAQGHPCSLVTQVSWILVQGPSSQLPRAVRSHQDDCQPLQNPLVPSSLVVHSPDSTSNSLRELVETSHAWPSSPNSDSKMWVAEPWIFLMSSPDAFYVAWEGDSRTTQVSLFLMSQITSRVHEKGNFQGETANHIPCGQKPREIQALPPLNALRVPESTQSITPSLPGTVLDSYHI